MTVTGTLASAAYDRLRDEIIGGYYKPGEKILIRHAADTFGIGPSPMREALNRLTSEGLLQLTDRRGFRVPPVSLQDLDELIHARCWANELCLRQSIRSGGLAWEERISSTLGRLAATPRHPNGKPEARNDRWEQAHEQFHAALISESGSSWIFDFCARTFVAAERYRHAARIATMVRADLEEHRAIAQAVLARREDEAVELLCEHFRLTGRHVREGLRDQL